jgi:adenylosuccinate lyase
MESAKGLVERANALARETKEKAEAELVQKIDEVVKSATKNLVQEMGDQIRHMGITVHYGVASSFGPKEANISLEVTWHYGECDHG